MYLFSSNNNNAALVDKDNRKGNQDSNTVPDYFEPLTGIQDTFTRVWRILCQRFLSILGPSTLAIVIWYCAALGIRYTFTKWSLQYQEYRTLEISGTEYAYQWEPLKVTISRVGLSLEFLLVFLLHCPAEATHFRTIANLYTTNHHDSSGAGGEGEPINSNQTVANTCWNKATSTCFPCTTFQVLKGLPPRRMGKLLVASFLWCLALLFPMGILIWCMAPEAESYYSKLEWLYLPYWPKLLGGSLYLVYSTIFMLATYFVQPILLFEQLQQPKNTKWTTNNIVLESFQQSYQVMQKENHWKHATMIILIWFLIKFIITKIVMMLNMMYYLQDYRVYQVWYILGIPLHPIRILYSNIDLWEFGRSWISVPFVIVIAAMGSIFKAVLYFDARVKQQQDGSCTVEMLQKELMQQVGSPDGAEATPYTSMADRMEGKQHLPEIQDGVVFARVASINL